MIIYSLMEATTSDVFMNSSYIDDLGEGIVLNNN